jgi:hypothetical protein
MCLKDKIKISGKALYYAGNPADGAQVTYTVSRKRQQRYLWWDYGYFRPNFNSNEMIIANGQLNRQARMALLKSTSTPFRMNPLIKNQILNSFLL